MTHRPRPCRRGVRGLDRPHRRASRRSSRSSTRRRSTSSRASRSCATRRARTTRCSPSAIAGELISIEIEIRSGRGEDLADALARQRDMRRAPVRAGRGRTASRSARPARTRGPTTASSRTSTPSTTAASSTGCSTSRGATTRSRCTSTSACATPTAPCASATACARCCRCCSPSAPTRRSSTARDSRPALGAHADVHEELPALRRPRRLRLVGTRSATTSTCSCATNSIVEYTQVWWSVRPHFTLRHGRGADLRRAVDGAGVRGAHRADRRLRRPGRARRRRGRPVRRPAAAPRSRRTSGARSATGMDGELIDLDARARSTRPPRPRRAAARVDRAGARASWASSRALPERNGAQRQRRAIDAGADMREVYAATVRETRETYAQEVEAA